MPTPSATYTIETIQKKARNFFPNIDEKLQLTTEDWEKIVGYLNTSKQLQPTQYNLLMIIELMTGIPNVCELLSKRNPVRATRKPTTPYPLASTRKTARDRFFCSHPSTRYSTPTLVAQGTPQSPQTPRKKILNEFGVQFSSLENVNTPTQHPVPLKQHPGNNDKSARLCLLARIGTADNPDSFRDIYAPYQPSILSDIGASTSEAQDQLTNLLYKQISSLSVTISAKSISEARGRRPHSSLKSVAGGVSARDIFQKEGKSALLEDESLCPAHWGHAIARIFNGPDLPHNLMPQTAKSNSRMTWPIIESPLRNALLKGVEITALYTVKPSYEADKRSLIPTNIRTEVVLRRERSIISYQFNINPRSNWILNQRDIKAIEALWEHDDAPMKILTPTI